MPRISVSDSKDYFLRDGKPFFYFADTAWMAFSNLSIAEWEEYIDYRAAQGFSVVQISLLPVLHDTSVSELNEFGFSIEDGKPQFNKINDAYFDKAVTMVEMAYKRGINTVLMPLWCNYIPDTWAAERVGEDFTMPYDEVEPYYQYITRRFAPFEPVYAVSGDTKFETRRVCEYYLHSLRLVKKYAPEALTTMHLAPWCDGLPEEFVQCAELDFYMYQSGHSYEESYGAYRIAEALCAKSVTRPVVNGEPCYEGSGHAFSRARFTAYEVRKASWQSVLSGAKAGVAYGAHGIWSFHRRDLEFPNEAFSGIPYAWRDALRFSGAWDVAFIKWMFETFSLFDIKPSNKICEQSVKGMDAFRMSESESRVVIYAPYNFDITIDGDYSGYKFTVIGLDDRRFAVPMVAVKDSKTTIRMHPFNSDALIIGEA